MLNNKSWRSNEPRLHFPIFSDLNNVIKLTLQEDNKITIKKYLSPLYFFLKKRKTFFSLINDYKFLFFSSFYKFRIILVDKNGKCFFSKKFNDKFKLGDTFYLNVNKILIENKIKIRTSTLILISNHGRPDLFGSSPGNISLSLYSSKFIAGYRTGFFTRSLNDGKKHYGFTGINPQIEINDNFISSLILINHSSNPLYKSTVNPTIRLYRNNKEFLETKFGKIKPHCYKEVSILELFPSAKKFLKKNSGKGYTITTLKGYTLASIHVIRSTRGEIVSMEHSRPSHTNIIKYF